MPKQVTVALVTNRTGAHIGAYLNAMRDTKACGAVVMADPDNRWTEAARKTLGPKLKAVHADAKVMLAKDKPAMAIVSMEAKAAPAATKPIAPKTRCPVSSIRAIVANIRIAISS